MRALTLDAIWRIANRYTPQTARYNERISHRNSWGPAHELGHALVATAEERTQRDYGLTCEPGMCRCPSERCHVVELAAMDVSRRLVIAAGAPRLADVELQATTDYDRMVSDATLQAARKLLVQRKLQRLPRTTAGLTELVRERMRETM